MEDDKLMKELEEATAEISKEVPTADNATNEQGAPTDTFLEEALKSGYNPNYDGPDKKTPEQFVKDGSFFKKINSLKKDQDELKNVMKELLQHNKKAEALGYQKALDDLKAQRDAAIEVGDVVKVNALDEHVYKAKEQLRQVEEAVVPKAPEVAPAALQFKEKNSNWFGKFDAAKGVAMTEEEKENQEMTEAALIYDDMLGRAVAEGRSNYTPEQAMSMVEDRMRKYYPHRFENPKKDEPIAVGRAVANSGVTQSPSSDLVGKMTEHQKEVYKMYISIDPKFGTLEEYAKTLEKIGDLK